MPTAVTRGKDLSEPRLPAERIVLAPEQRQHGQVGERGLERPLDPGHDRIDPQHSSQDLLRRAAAAAEAPGSTEAAVVDQETDRPADILDGHRDVLQVEGVDEILGDLGVRWDAVVVAGDIGRQSAARDIQG